MSRHVFLAPEGTAHPRWREAFAEAQILDRLPPPDSLAPDDVLWISADLPLALETIATVHRAHPGLAIVLISLHPGEDEALQGLDAGARGYCHAWATPSLLQQVAVVVSNGGLWVGPELLNRVISATRSLLPPHAPESAPGLAALTEREREVAREVVKGLSNKEIARMLGITERTVKAHLGVVFAKLGIRDRLHLVLHFAATHDHAGIEM